jgi:aryl-alcohol dehydrogenase-like predicted oxidoreductase
MDEGKKNRQDIVLATKVGSETKEHGFDISKKHILNLLMNL